MGHAVFVNDLRNKEVINVASGKRLGYVVDLELEPKEAGLLALLVSGETGGLFRREPPLRIPWACILHIGEDLIIVSVKHPAARP